MPFGILDCKKMEVVPGTGKHPPKAPSVPPFLATWYLVALHPRTTISERAPSLRTHTAALLTHHGGPAQLS